MNKNLHLIGYLLLITSMACSDEVDVSAPYKNITVVYGLLNPDQSEGTIPDTNWIRIQKAYLVDDNALMYPGIPDCTYYAPVLDHYVLGYDVNGTKVPSDSFYLERVENPPGIVKDSGLFANYNTVLYKGIKVLDPTHSYELIIRKQDGEVVNAKTGLPGKSIVIPPMGALNWYLGPVDAFNVPTCSFQWTNDLNTYAYQLGLQLNYEEWPVGSPSAKVQKNVSRFFQMVRFDALHTCNFNRVCCDINANEFYKMITDQIFPTQDYQRRIKNVDIIVAHATRELYEYIKSGEPTYSFADKIYKYTNINNGVGIFASRRYSRLNGVMLHPVMIGNPALDGLNFVY